MITGAISRPSVENSPSVAFNFPDEVQHHYRALLRRIGWPSADAVGGLQTIGVTSCLSGEGVTTVATQLAATAAAIQKRPVLLVDANILRPATPRVFQLRPAAGLADAVAAGSLDAVEFQHPPVTNLSVLSAGSLSEEPEHVFDSPALAGLIDELKSQFELVVFDLPAMQPQHAPLRLAQLLDGLLLVVQSHRVNWQTARHVRDLLVNANVSMLGTVLNR
jgi:succinoglycan biosynthesis transport protein ExoP